MERITDNKELMRRLAAIDFADFSSAAEANFDERFNEWHVTFFRFDYFHYFSRQLTPDRKEEAIAEAFDYLQLIARHEGRLNICGVFLEGREDIKIFEQKRAYGEIRLAHSEVLNRWFWSSSYQNHNGGGGFAASISEDINICSAPMREEAYLAASEHLYEAFRYDRHRDTESSNALIAQAAREAIEKAVIELLGRHPKLPIPAFIAQTRSAVQQSLF